MYNQNNLIMKNKIMLKLMVVIYFCVFTKSSAQDNIVTMDSNMNIRINVNTIDNLSETYTIDVSGFHFESEKSLQTFCYFTSIDFYSLSGDYASKQIIIKFNKDSLLERQYTIEKINNSFTVLSGRLRTVYNKLNQL